MDHGRRIGEALARVEQIFQAKPHTARFTSVTTVRLNEGLACEISDGKWRLTADQGPSLGGENEGPSPGVLGHSALGVCLAQGYRMWLARSNVPVKSIEVRVEADGDARGGLGLTEDSPPGYAHVRCHVSVESEADEALVRAALDEADRHSPWLYNFASPINVSREVSFR